jgi:hypothetical protein
VSFAEKFYHGWEDKRIMNSPLIFTNVEKIQLRDTVSPLVTITLISRAGVQVSVHRD